VRSADKNPRETAKFLNNLTEFISSEDREMKELRDSLIAQGVDPEESLQQFRQLLSEYAPTWREKAARARAVVAASFGSQRDKIQLSRTGMQDGIREIVESMRALGAPIEAGAYHRNFKEARDEDLESLLEDLRFQYELLLKKQEKADSDG
jgi:hypothetical protein